MVFRRRRSTPPDLLTGVDPTAVPAAYRVPVDDALRARAQFGELVAGLRDGPLQDRLRELGTRVDAGVLTSPASAGTEIAGLEAELDQLVGELDALGTATTELGELG